MGQYQRNTTGLSMLLATVLTTPALARPPDAGVDAAVAKVCKTAQECYEIGRVKLRLGEMDDAENFFERSAEMTPRDRAKAMMIYNRGIARLYDGDPAAARKFFNEYIATMGKAKKLQDMPDDLVKKMTGLLIYEEGQRACAQKQTWLGTQLLKEAFLFPLEKHGWVTLQREVGKCYERAGQYRTAKQWYEGFINLPDFPAQNEKSRIRSNIKELERKIKRQEQRQKKRR